MAKKKLPKAKPRDKSKPRHDHPPQSKHEPVELDGVLERVAYLERMGYRQVDIAKDLGVSQPMVSKYLGKISKMYQESTLINRHELIQREFALLMDVRRKAEQALLLSEQGKKKRHQETMIGGEGGGYSKEGMSEEGLLPPSEYMNVLIKTNERICDMFGLDDAVKNIFNVTATQNNTVIASPQDIAALILGVRSQPDDVEAKLKAIEDLPAAQPATVKDENAKPTPD